MLEHFNSKSLNPTKKGRLDQEAPPLDEPKVHPDLFYIWKLTSCPEEEFRLTYEAFYLNIVRHFLCQHTTIDLRQQLRFAAKSISTLRGHPYQYTRGSNRADASNEATKFALFIACLIEYIVDQWHQNGDWLDSLVAILPALKDDTQKDPTEPGNARALLFMKMISIEGLQWLNEKPFVLEELFALFQRTRETVLEALILEVPKLKEDSSPQKRSKSLRVNYENSGLSMILWLRSELHASRLTINESESLVHRVDGKVCLISPQVFEEFSKASNIPPKRVKKKFVQLGIHELCDELNHHRVAIGDSGIHDAYLIPNEQLFWLRSPPDNPAIKMVEVTHTD
jgi:hypothetical protein